MYTMGETQIFNISSHLSFIIWPREKCCCVTQRHKDVVAFKKTSHVSTCKILVKKMKKVSSNTGT